MRQGIVAGIAGYLIAEGDRLGLDVTAILADCNPMYPDARAAALAVEAVTDLTGIDIPLSSLLEDARKLRIVCVRYSKTHKRCCLHLMMKSTHHSANRVTSRTVFQSASVANIGSGIWHLAILNPLSSSPVLSFFIEDLSNTSGDSQIINRNK